MTLQYVHMGMKMKCKGDQLTWSQCYLCPRNKRAQGDSNPDYNSTFVFVNDYSAVKEQQAEYSPPKENGSELFEQQCQRERAIANGD